MPNNKRKRVSKIKGKEKAHPYSRKAKQISRAMHKESQIAKAKAERTSGAMARGQKVVWFRDNLDTAEGKKLWTIDELREFVDRYLVRNQDEVDELAEKKKAGRALSPREAFFLQAIEVEAREARLAGIEVPDLTNGAVVRTLRAWDGDLNSITTIKLIKCRPASAVQPTCASANSEDQEIAKLTGMTVG